MTSSSSTSSSAPVTSMSGEGIVVDSDKNKHSDSEHDGFDPSHDIAELRDSAEELMHHVGDYINRNPVQSAGYAFAAGVLTAMLLGRR